MNDDQPINERVATGWARTELAGDVETAKTHQRAARKMLGALRVNNGVNDRIAAGEGGGFFKNQMQMEDGTHVEVYTNNGVDTIRITTPRMAPSAASSSSGEGERGHADAHSEETSSMSKVWDEPPPVARSSEETDESVVKKTKSGYPALWIGARIKSGGLDILGNKAWADPNNGGDFVQLHLCVWEPTDKPGDDPVILSNRHHLLLDRHHYYSPDYYMTPDVYPLRDLPWIPVSENISPYGDGPRGMCYTPHKMIQISKSQRDYAAEQLGIDLSDALIAPDDDGSRIEYDEVVICDQDDALNLGMKGEIQDGTYTVKIMAYANDCVNFTPIEVELHIIAGDGPTGAAVTHTFTLNEYTRYFRGVLPKGYWLRGQQEPTDEDCFGVPDVGPNPMAGHWWQGGAEIIVAPYQIEVPEEEFIEHIIAITDKEGERLVPPSGFEVDATWPARDERCVECDANYTFYQARQITGEPMMYNPFHNIVFGQYTPVQASFGYSYAYHRWSNPFRFSKALFDAAGNPKESSGEIFFSLFKLGGGMPFEPDPGNPTLEPVSMTYPAGHAFSEFYAGPQIDDSQMYKTQLSGKNVLSCVTAWKVDYVRSDTGVLSGTASYVSFSEYLAAVGGINMPNPIVTHHRIAYHYEVWTGELDRIPPYAPTYKYFPHYVDGTPDSPGYGPATPTP